MKLRRSPGIPIHATSLSLANPWGRTSDHNGYYEILDIPPDAWMREVHQAYRRRLRDFHPDTSRTPSVYALEKVRIAYKVLSNPHTRRAYDSSSTPWLDSLIIQTQIRRLSMTLSFNPSNVEDVLRDYKQRIGAEKLTGIRSKPFYSLDLPPVLAQEYKFFYLEDEVIPSLLQRNRWILLFCEAMNLFQKRKELHIGFTTGPPFIKQEKWGKIFFVSGEPNRFIAIFLAANA